MSKSLSNIKQSFKDTLLFAICYFFLFLFLIRTFNDSSETKGMLALFDFFVIIILTVYFLFLNLTVQTITGKTIGLWIKALLFVILVELSVLTLTGELPLYGLLQKYIYSKKSYTGDKTVNESIFLFRQSRNFSLSIAGLTSAILFLIIKGLTNKKNNELQNISFQSRE